MLCGSYFCPVKFSSQCLKLPHFVYIISSSCMCVIDLVFSDIHSYVFCVFASHPFLFKYILYHKTSPPFPHNPITIHTRWQDGDWFYLSPSQLTCGQGATVATILGSRSTIEWLDLSRKKMGQGWKKEPRQPISTWIATKAAYKCAPQVSSPLSFDANVFALCLRNTSQFSNIFNPFANVNIKKYKIDVLLFVWQWITV